ncbi:MAG: hypothetical protein ACR2J9_09385 [Gaiellales bacterium]
MTNPRRHERPHELMHVIANSVHRDRLFPDSGWMTYFDQLFAIEAEERSWDVWCHVLMGTHYHLLLSTPDCSLSAGLQRLHLRMALERNADRHRRGRLFSSPHRAITIRDEGHLASCLRYIPTNPVKAGLCSHPADWRWGSFRALAGYEEVPDWLRAEEVRRFLSAPTSASLTSWVMRTDRPEPPLNERDWKRYDVDRCLLLGMSREEVAAELNISVRWVERLAVRSGRVPPGVEVR